MRIDLVNHFAKEIIGAWEQFLRFKSAFSSGVFFAVQSVLIYCQSDWEGTFAAKRVVIYC